MRMVNNTYEILQRFASKASLLFLLVVVLLTNIATAQCPLACNNSVQLSLDFQCEGTITPDLVLEGHDEVSCEYFIILFDEDDVEIGRTSYAPNDNGTPGNSADDFFDVIHPTVDGSSIGTTVGVEIYTDNTLDDLVDLDTANSCWAAVVVEDKIPTQIVCPPDFTLLCIEDLTQTMLLNEMGSTSYESADDLAEIVLPSTTSNFTVAAVNGAYGFELITDIEICPTLSAGSLSDLSVTITDPAGSIVGVATGPVSNCFNTSDFDLTVANDGFISGDWVISITNNGAVNAVVESVDFSVEVKSALAIDYDGDNCDDTSVSITGDEFLDYDCRPDANLYTMQREITWSATDASGNATTCSFIISYEKGDLADVLMPADILIDAALDIYSDSGATLAGDDGRFDCGLDIYNAGLLSPTPNGAGVPTLGGHSLFPMALDNVCKFNVSYDDQMTTTCGSNFKIIRTFYIYDWCNAEVTEFRQIIKSKDEVGPTATTAYGLLTTAYDADDYSCSTTFTVDFFSDVVNNDGPGSSTISLGGILGDCSGTEVYAAGYLEANADGTVPPNGTAFIYNDGRVVDLGNGQYQFTDMEGPRIWLKFLVQDQCENKYLFPTSTGQELASITVEVDIIDIIPPVAVCDEFTAVTLNENGWGRVYAESLDDGSHDYCDDVLTYEVRRSSSDACSEFSETNDQIFGEFIQVCCDDLGEDIEVELRVTDSSGNSSICTVIVRPQSLVGSVSSSCTLSSLAGSDIDNDGVYDTSYDVDCDVYNSSYKTDRPSATFSGPCNIDLTVFSKDTEIFTTCGDYSYGAVSRSWFVKFDGVDVNLNCTQTITVGYNPDLSTCVDPDAASCNITWPNDRLNETGCLESDADPDGYNDFPTYKNTGMSIDNAPGCGMLAYTYTDQVFTDVEDACFKIVRTWTVIDWCLYSTTDPSPEGIYTNSQVIKLDNNDAPIFTGSTASSGDQSGTSFCTPANSCTMSIVMSTAAKDACTDNPITTTSRYSYTLVNTSTTPNTTVATGDGTTFTRTLGSGNYSITWNVVGACDITSKDIYNFTVSDCTAPVPYCKGGITTAILPGANSVEVWASDLDLNSSDECDNDLQFTFADGNSNKTFTCDDLGDNTVTIYVEDDAGNSDFCTTTITIQANNGACNSAARVMIAGNVSTEASEALTEVNVSLEHMSDNSMSYESTLEDGHYAFEELLSLEDYHLTADFNDDPRNGISTLDLVLIQRHILNLESLDSAYKIIAADANASETITAADMVDIRKLILHVQDVYPNNKSWRFIDANKQYIDETYPWPLAEDILISEMQEDAMSVNWVGVKIGDVNGSVTINGNTSNDVENRDDNALMLEIKEVESGIYQVISKSDITLTGAQFQLYLDGITTISRGELNFNENMISISDNAFALSYDNINGVALSEGSVLFTIQASSSVAAQLGDMIRAEAYDEDLNILDIQIENAKVGSEFALYQNVPNPFALSTSIGFSLPKAGFATLDVMDINGRILYSLNKLYEKGMNKATIEASMLPSAGVVYYRLHFDGNMETRKMILLD